MKQQYAAPRLAEYGRLEKLTLGQHGTMPDYNTNSGQVANNNCFAPGEGPGESGDSNPFICLTGPGNPGSLGS